MPSNLRAVDTSFHPASPALIEPIPRSKNESQHGQAFYRAAVAMLQSGEAPLLAGNAKRLFEIARRTITFHNNSDLYHSPFPEQSLAVEPAPGIFIEP